MELVMNLQAVKLDFLHSQRPVILFAMKQLIAFINTELTKLAISTRLARVHNSPISLHWCNSEAILSDPLPGDSLLIRSYFGSFRGYRLPPFQQ